MRRILGFVLVATMAAAVPLLAHSEPIQTDTDCANSSQGVHLAIPRIDTYEIDRGSDCISDENADNGAELYVGGELNANKGGGTLPSQPIGGPCGGIEVMGIQEELNVVPGFPGTPMGGDNWGGQDCQ